MSTTLYRLGPRAFSLDHIQSIDLEYDPKRYDRHRPPSPDAGVQLVMASGHQLAPFWGPEARCLRAFLTGGEVDLTRLERAGVIVVTLTPWPEPASVEPDPVPTWNGEPITPEQLLAKLSEMRPEPCDPESTHIWRGVRMTRDQFQAELDAAGAATE